jgi:hypothetical protein
MTQLYSLVCQLAADLQREGKTPSLALVRARAGKGVDAPALFNAYQQWRANPPAAAPAKADNQHSANNVLQTEVSVTASDQAAEIAALQQQVLRLEQKLDLALALLQQLQQRSDQ